MPSAISTSSTKHTYTYSRKRPSQESIATPASKRIKLASGSSSCSEDEEDERRNRHSQRVMEKQKAKRMELGVKNVKNGGNVTITSMFAKHRSSTKTTTVNVNTTSRKPVHASSKPKLTQLHLDIGSTSLRTCAHCDLSYTIGAPDDEALHRAHCARVQRGVEWSRDVDRDPDVVDVARGISLRDRKSKGRIISVRGDIGGKVGSKMATLLSTVDLALSSPPLTRDILKKCKIYLFLLPSSSLTGAQKERIAGCVVAQHITIARALATADESGSLSVSPELLPTPLGIARLFVSSKSRRLGIASELLTHAAATFIHGCPLDPSKGEVAFTQPTGAGEGVMKVWGNGAVRVYDEGGE